MGITESDEDDAMLAGNREEPIQRQEASPEVQGVNVQVCSNEYLNKC
jgi:hypothetical protein